MCNVCEAGRVLQAKGEPVVYRWPSGASLEIRLVEGTAPEFTRAVVQLRRTAEDPWSDPLVTEDLAGLMGRLGLDIKWKFMPEDVRAWVTGAGPMPSLDWLQVSIAAVPAEEVLT